MEARMNPFDGTILKLPGKLDRLLRHGCNLPKGATYEIPLIKGDLEKIIAITSSLENHQALMARYWRKEVRELSYDMEDFIDQYEHAVERIQRWGAQEGPPKPALQFCPWIKEWKIASEETGWNKRTRRRERKNRIKSKAALPWLREKLRLRLWMANEIREFSLRTQEALERHCSYNIGGISSTRCTDAAYPTTSVNSTCGEEDTYVGISAALEKLQELLMMIHDHRHKKLEIVSIVGFGGIGKTTLAVELYRKLGRQFECRAFVRTSQKPDMRRIFISMLSQVRPHQPPDNWTVHGLISTIRTHLQDKRYLIIVEDLCATPVWDIVKCALPDSNCCSRVLITTEIDDLALQCCAHDPNYIYKMQPLDEESSRKLFFSSVFGPQHECPPELKEISYDIISKCGGLPLVIVTVASILSSQPATQDQWHHVNNSIGYSLLTNHSLEGMKEVLDLSYNNLPHYLKACLLYTGLYEEDIIICKDDLVNQWIAEGFIQAPEGQDKKEMARSYFDRLISGKLILPVDINRNGEVLSCTVHHMVLNLVIRYKSTEENFVTAIHHSKATTTFADKVRRLSLQFGNATDAKTPSNVSLTHVRTLAIWGVFNCLPSVVQFPLLQVLILHVWGDKDSISLDITRISELFRLRYLKVKSNATLRFCSRMRNMQSLETLSIDARVSAVPSDIVHLPGLLNLSLPAKTKLPNGIGDMISLRTLGHFDLSSNSMENVQSLRMLTNLEDLQLTCSTVQPEYLKDKMYYVLNSIFGGLSNLKSLTLVPRGSGYAKSIDDAGAAGTIISADLPSAPALVQSIKISPRICTFFCLPKWIGQLRKLCVLKFGVRKIDRDGFDVLGGLPSLAVLSLYVQIKPEMWIVIGKTGFSVIKFFKFTCCDPWLKFEEGAMSNLRKLKLSFNACNADQKSTIPIGINNLSELKVVSAKIGGAGTEESHTRAAESAFRDAIRMHDTIQKVKIQWVQQINFCNDYNQSSITPVDDWPRWNRSDSIQAEQSMTSSPHYDDHQRKKYGQETNTAAQYPRSTAATGEFHSDVVLRRDQNQIHSLPPPPDTADAFQRRAADLLADLLQGDVLSLAWTCRLLDAFLLCLEEFRALLYGSGDPPAIAQPPLDRLVVDFFDGAIKALDLCNAVRDGLDLLRQWRKHLAIAADVLTSSASTPLGETQIRRARKVLTDPIILRLDDRDGGGVVVQRNRSFGRAKDTHRQHGRSSSGGSAGSSSGSHLMSWTVSRAWSASRQLQAIGEAMLVPRPHDNAATGGLASAVYTMGAVLFIVAFALVAAIPCQDRGLQAHFSVPRNFPCSGPVTALYDRILEESKKKERKNSCGLLKEIYQIQVCSRHLMEITDAAEFPLHKEEDAKVREAAQDLVQLCESIKDGLDPLERQVREMFHRIVRTHTEILDCLSKPHGVPFKKEKRHMVSADLNKAAEMNTEEGSFATETKVHFTSPGDYSYPLIRLINWDVMISYLYCYS